jgi:hypothetical protein
MKVAYSNGRLFFNLLMGFFWIGTRIVNFMGDDKFKWLDYAFLVFGIAYLIGFFIEYYMKYFSYDELEITLFGWRKKTIQWKDLIELKYFAGTYTFRTLDNTIAINKSTMNKKARLDFENCFQQIKLNFENLKAQII